MTIQVYKKRPLGKYRTLPTPDSEQNLIGDRYATKKGLLKRYRVGRHNRKHGAFSQSLQYKPQFEKKAVRLFYDMFPEASAGDGKAYRNYLRGYIGNWDYGYLLIFVEANVRIHQTFYGTLSKPQQAYLDANLAMKHHDDLILDEIADDYFIVENQLLQKQAKSLFNLIQSDNDYALLTKLMIREMIRAQRSYVGADVVKREMRRFITDYLVPRMSNGAFTGEEAEYWQTFLAKQIDDWWD
uniref:hypothetical protein n=1 Tax=Lentilactobacillus hilgardii TaxID=1588 RepID=UPI00403F9899